MDDRMAEILEIHKLKALYFRLMDEKRWDEWKEVFSEDFVGVYDGPHPQLRFEGRDQLVAENRKILATAKTVHHGHMPEIELTGPDTARGIWAMFDYVEWPPSDSGERIGLRGYGHYHEEYVREDGEWRIARTRLVRLRVDPLT